MQLEVKKKKKSPLHVDFADLYPLHVSRGRDCFSQTCVKLPDAFPSLCLILMRVIGLERKTSEPL